MSIPGGCGCAASATANDETSRMQILVKGIHRLCASEFRSSHTLFQLPGRQPEALLITCSDLAIDPYSLIPTNGTDLYVLKNFGNLAASYDAQRPDQVNSVENAFALYPIQDLVVCGHTSCHAMTYLVPRDGERDAELPAVRNALRHAARTRQIMAERYGHLEGESLLTAASQENVLVQLENVRTIPAVASRLERGNLHLHGWIYSCGAIFAYDPREEQFVPLVQ
jgi:carbonic anhydrase